MLTICIGSIVIALVIVIFFALATDDDQITEPDLDTPMDTEKKIEEFTKEFNTTIEDLIKVLENREQLTKTDRSWNINHLHARLNWLVDNAKKDFPATLSFYDDDEWSEHMDQFSERLMSGNYDPGKVNQIYRPVMNGIQQLWDAILNRNDEDLLKNVERLAHVRRNAKILTIRPKDLKNVVRLSNELKRRFRAAIERA